MSKRIMTPGEALHAQMGMFKKALDIVVPKRHDYSSGADPLLNLRQCEMIGIKPEMGVIIRMMDKLTRISRLVEHEAQVKDEGVMDTVLDLINYASILGLLYMENRSELFQEFIDAGWELEGLVNKLAEE